MDAKVHIHSPCFLRDVIWIGGGSGSGSEVK